MKKLETEKNEAEEKHKKEVEELSEKLKGLEIEKLEGEEKHKKEIEGLNAEMSKIVTNEDKLKREVADESLEKESKEVLCEIVIELRRHQAKLEADYEQTLGEKDGGELLVKLRKENAELIEQVENLRGRLSSRVLIANEEQIKRLQEKILDLQSDLAWCLEMLNGFGISPSNVKNIADVKMVHPTEVATQAMEPPEMLLLLKKVVGERFELYMRCRQLEAEAGQAKAELEKWRSETVQKYIWTHKSFAPPATPVPSKNILSVFASGIRPISSSPMSKKDVVNSVQAVLEDTIVKNAQLQNDVVSMGEECDSLLEYTHILERRLREQGIEVPKRPPVKKTAMVQQQLTYTANSAAASASASANRRKLYPVKRQMSLTPMGTTSSSLVTGPTEASQPRNIPTATPMKAKTQSKGPEETKK